MRLARLNPSFGNEICEHTKLNYNLIPLQLTLLAAEFLINQKKKKINRIIIGSLQSSPTSTLRMLACKFSD